MRMFSAGPGFLDYLDDLPPMQRDYDGPIRAIVSDNYGVRKEEPR